MTTAEFSEKELETRNKVLKNSVPQDLGELNTGNQLPEKLTEEQQGEAKLQTRIDGIIDKMVGKKDGGTK